MAAKKKATRRTNNVQDRYIYSLMRFRRRRGKFWFIGPKSRRTYSYVPFTKDDTKHLRFPLLNGWTKRPDIKLIKPKKLFVEKEVKKWRVGDIPESNNPFCNFY